MESMLRDSLMQSKKFHIAVICFGILFVVVITVIFNYYFVGCVAIAGLFIAPAGISLVKLLVKERKK